MGMKWQGRLLLVEDENLRDVAWFGELKRTLTFPLDRSSVAGRSIYDMRPVSIDDLQNAGDEFGIEDVTLHEVETTAAGESLGSVNIAKALQVSGIGKRVKHNDLVLRPCFKPIMDEVRPDKPRAAGN